MSLLSEPAAETEMSQEGNRRTSNKGKDKRSGLGRRDDGKAAFGGRILKPNRTDRRSPLSVPQGEVPLQKGWETTELHYWEES